MKIQERGVVISNLEKARGLHFMEIYLPEISNQIKPGNFVSLLPPSSSSAFLRRPFSVAGIGNKSIKLVIRDIGKATHSITSLREKMPLRCWGHWETTILLLNQIKKYGFLAVALELLPFFSFMMFIKILMTGYCGAESAPRSCPGQNSFLLDAPWLQTMDPVASAETWWK